MIFECWEILFLVIGFTVIGILIMLIVDDTVKKITQKIVINNYRLIVVSSTLEL